MIASGKCKFGCVDTALCAADNSRDGYRRRCQKARGTIINNLELIKVSDKSMQLERGSRAKQYD